jgi:hypothetical protein
MAELVQRLFTYIPQNTLRIGGEQWSRTLGPLNAWSRIRIGLLCAVMPNNTANIVSNFNFGLCNGSAFNSGASAYAQSAIGACMTGSMLSAAWTLTYNANSGNPFFSTSAAGKLFRRSGYHLVESSSLAQSAIALAGVGVPKRRTPIYLDITRNVGGQGLSTIACYSTSTAQVTFDIRLDHFLDGLDQIAAPTINGQTLTTELSTTMALSDMLGALDSMFIMFQNAAFPLEIYAVGASVSRDLNYVAGSGGAYDGFEQYGTGTATGAILSQGSGFSTQALINGTFFTQSNPGIQIGYAGTSANWPYDPFETYGVGTVVNGVTLFQGSNWAANGSIY